ncbi:MAG: hypothetical protein QNJ33_06740 [Crocosphaera sp.]|nr:hypothetical protein [Crocosphaera sp.]
METSFTLIFDNKSTAQVLKVQPGQNLTSALSTMNLTERRPVLVLIGGASQISEADLVRLKYLFVEVLAPLAQELGLFVADGGTHAGVMGLMGSAKHQINGTFPLIGVTPIDLVKLPNHPNPSPDAATLEPHHSHFFLVPGSQWGDESPWLAQIASTLAGDHPSVTILINGGAITLVDATENVKVDRPLIVIAQSGRLADEIAASLSQPEQEMRQEIASLIKMGQVTVFNLSDSFSQLKELLREKLSILS